MDNFDHICEVNEEYERLKEGLEQKYYDVSIAEEELSATIEELEYHKEELENFEEEHKGLIIV